MWLEAVSGVSSGLVVYHHLAYPVLLRQLAKRASRVPFEAAPLPAGDMPSLTLIVPAYNEARHIEAKIANITALNYPDGRIQAVIVCDGCTDATARVARDAIHALAANRNRFRLVTHRSNRGKVAVINETIAEADSDLVALSDASAQLAPNALAIAAGRFADPNVGFVTGVYALTAGEESARIYWNYQTAIKEAEAAIDSPIGAHGAFYMFRRAPWAPLESDTINDDVVLPMRIVEKGYRGVYDPAIDVVESEVDTPFADLHRRARLGAGAIQQTMRLWRLGDPRRPGLAFSFLSGKALRAVMPFVLIIAFLSNLALLGAGGVWSLLFALQCGGYGVAALGLLNKRIAALPIANQLVYLVRGHAIGLVGATRYLLGLEGGPWKSIDAAAHSSDEGLFFDEKVAGGKRALDVAIACCAFVGLAVLFAPIALAIKLESRGPILYRQLRVGLRTPTYSRLFYLTKFRTMRSDAEARSGAVWATEHDPRVTRVGRFLRKTRLDELPQCIDVLRGEMSVVGPRPERPQFFTRLEREIPFYSERTYGLKPGITGLAQVTLPYDSTIEDVRAKVLHDHAYAMQLSTPRRWLIADLTIILRTFTVMVLGKGR